MTEGRIFEERPGKVAAGLVDGRVRTGTLERFDPAAETLCLQTPTRARDGRLELVPRELPARRISYVAFYRETHPCNPPDEGLSETRVYTPGGNTFSVRVPTAELEDRAGFYGFPLSRASLYSEIFFFADRLTAVEDATPLGQILVREGLLDAGTLDAGTAAQAAGREAPVGEILVEQEGVDAVAVEQAVVDQRGRRKSGRSLRLGEILVEAGLATADQISRALAEQKDRRGKRLGEVLVELGVVSEEAIARTLAAKFRLPYVDLDETGADPNAVSEISQELILRFRVLPYKTNARSLFVAMADPTAIEALDMLRFSLKKRLQEAVVKPSQLARYMEPYLPRGEAEVDQLDVALAELMTESEEDELDAEAAAAHEAAMEEGAVTRLAYKMILAAWKRGASDIHIEPNGAGRATQVRFRVDGSCEVYRQLAPVFRASLVSRVKIMAGLDITERRRPQDGKIRLSFSGQKLELRVATLPTVDGNEDVVLRLLASSEAIPLAELGLSEYAFENTRSLVERPYGLFLVAGPTGSGKTTTLHSCLAAINTEERKIWTAEDPVEITQPGLRQVQVHADIGFTFAAAMRSFLRADPDVVMVGEMRDLETAATGVEASLTGHLVMSTLHTNSAPETVTRLVDMGLDPFTFSDALLGVLAQRLARRLCMDCKVSYEPAADERAEILRLYGAQASQDGLDAGPMTLWRPVGCSSCRGGYKGRLGIHELLVTDDAIKQTIQQGNPAATIRDAAIAGGMRTLLQDGIIKSLDGHTDLSQVLAVCSR